MTLTQQERRDLIRYGYDMLAKAKRARRADTRAKWQHEAKAAWAMINYQGY